jgi:2,3,4,5-tetrahydropyridine-2-carboxylate N-succinyltransferase
VGGVIWPIRALPVIIEDEALIGSNTGIYEGAVIKARGRGGRHRADRIDRWRPRARQMSSPPPIVRSSSPRARIVVPGARAVTAGKGVEWGLSLATPVIVKYRDSRTDTRTELEAWIR